MKRFLPLILTTFFIIQLSVLTKATDFRIKGIGIGSTYSTVIKNLGKPLSGKKGGIVPCSDGSTLLTLRYQGLVIELSKDEDQKNFTIFSIGAISPKWAVSGVNIGSSIKTINSRFGQPYHQSNESGLKGLHYNNNKGESGAASFYFQGDKLKKIELYLNYC